MDWLTDPVVFHLECPPLTLVFILAIAGFLNGFLSAFGRDVASWAGQLFVDIFFAIRFWRRKRLGRRK